jgi:indole-3-glycerol phosphate synthase
MNILEKITAEKRREVEALRPRASELKWLAAQRKDRRDFAAVLRKPSGLALIAEVKKASPSAGVIRENFDPIAIAIEYEKAGASAISVLTDEKFFQGHISYLQNIREKVSLPLLRKDFIIDALQIYEAAAYGADAVLLIAAMIEDGVQLAYLYETAKEVGLEVLFEVHNEEEMSRAYGKVIGVNNRDLKTFKVDLATTEGVLNYWKRQVFFAEKLPKRKFTELPDRIFVAESGINTRADAERVKKAGVNAILVGESLMRSGNIAAKVKELLG